MSDDGSTDFARDHARLIRTLYGRSGGAAWGLSEAAFARALERSAKGTPADAATHLATLHVEDLALAAACEEGLEPAWEHLVTVYQRDLRNAGRAIAGESLGVELADSIYADLYGTEVRDGRRRSLFAYFHGRSRLSTWLRAILAQRHVDWIRERRRLEPLDDREEAIASASAARALDPPDPDRRPLAAAFGRAVASAVRRLSDDQRLRLAWYYTHGLTLAQIGRRLGEHEATASRKLDRIRRDLRRLVEAVLVEEDRLSPAEVDLCYQYGLDAGDIDFAGLLRSSSDAPAPPEADPASAADRPVPPSRDRKSGLPGRSKSGAVV